MRLFPLVHLVEILHAIAIDQQHQEVEGIRIGEGEDEQDREGHQDEEQCQGLATGYQSRGQRSFFEWPPIVGETALDVLLVQLPVHIVVEDETGLETEEADQTLPSAR